MIDISRIADVINVTRPVQKTGRGYRVCGMTHRDQFVKPLEGGGAHYSDGRFHIREMCNTTYIAKDIRTAMLESRKVLLSGETGQLHGDYTAPFVIFSLRFDLRKVLDLTDINVLEDMAVDASEITGNWWQAQTTPITQIIGSQAHLSERFHAIAYRSARNSLSSTELDDEYDTNFAIFPDKLDGGSYVEAIAPGHQESDSSYVIGKRL